MAEFTASFPGAFSQNMTPFLSTHPEPIARTVLKEGQSASSKRAEGYSWNSCRIVLTAINDILVMFESLYLANMTHLYILPS